MVQWNYTRSIKLAELKGSGTIYYDYLCYTIHQ